MTMRPNPGDFALDAFLLQQESKSLLRFVACGSVDHGKSSLLGRLLYEAKLLLDDQLSTLAADTRKHGAHAGELDFSLLLDGLAAEREQKITIDVAYRFFTTERRKFIVADAPGHEQYTRNMATGASTADLALILINAVAGLTRQTKRHSLIVSMLGVRHLVVAVNKMDLVGWSESAFASIQREFRSFAEQIDVDEIVFIPTSARSGDNIVIRSSNMGWYRGPTLLEHLERVEIAPPARRNPFRMPIQWVNRPDPAFRGYCGLVAGGEVRPGMRVQLSPSGQVTQVERIVTADGDLQHAAAGQSVTLTLKDDIDASRGDVIAELRQPPAATDRLNARIFWMGKDPLAAGRRYLVKLGTCTATATVGPALQVIDLDTHRRMAVDALTTNAIGHCRLELDRPIPHDRYADNRVMGSLILIDPETYDTIGMGLVEQSAPQPQRIAEPIKTKLARLIRPGAALHLFDRSGDSRARSIAKALSWRATGSFDTFFLGYIITGNTIFAGSIAFAEIVTKIMFYYFHERIWSLVSWGRRQRGSI